MEINSFRNEFFFLSNFYPCTIEIDGKTYASSEHYYQACKALDENEHELIRGAASPAETKKLARKIKSFRPDWDTYRLHVMWKALQAKFSIPELREALLMTEDFELIEGNWWYDTFWGVCNGEGKNTLGKMLMMLRTKLRDEKTEEALVRLHTESK